MRQVCLAALWAALFFGTAATQEFQETNGWPANFVTSGSMLSTQSQMSPGQMNPMWQRNAQPHNWNRFVKQSLAYHKKHYTKKKWPPPPPITNKLCPLKKCRGISKKKQKQFSKPEPEDESLIELSSFQRGREPSKPLKTDVGPGPDELHEVDEDTGMSIYEVNFKPGHFTCLSCDVGTCEGCDIMCDLSLCLGEFYTQECWCMKDSMIQLKKPLWWFREYDAKWMTHDSVYQFFCDNSCHGSICNTKGIQCKARQEACKPWWWCNLAPPAHDNLKPKDGWDDGFSYVSTPNLLQLQDTLQLQDNARREYRSSTHSTSMGKLRKSSLSKSRSSEASASTMNLALHEARKAAVSEKERLNANGGEGAKARVGRPEDDARVFEPNDYATLKFGPGRWTCESAALPPRVQNPTSYLWVDRGYIVMDRFACKGSTFDHKCFCWDNVAYLRGGDALTSEFKCDDTCGWGNCEGKTCGSAPPPPLPPPPPPPVMDAIAVEQARSGELKNSNNKMTPA